MGGIGTSSDIPQMYYNNQNNNLITRSRFPLWYTVHSTELYSEANFLRSETPVKEAKNNIKQVGANDWTKISCCDGIALSQSIDTCIRLIEYLSFHCYANS